MQSNRYLTWKAILDLRTCKICRTHHGKIYDNGEWIEPEPPVHEGCRCVIDVLQAILAGWATNNGRNGADWWLKRYGRLPDYYITLKQAEAMG